MSSRFSVDVFAYVLMGNHYHLLLRTNRPNISKSIQWLGVTYTRRFNVKHHRNGHLFQGRFKSFLVENEKYLLVLSCYIHRNPLRAGIVRRLADYPWSSYTVYAYGKPSPDWLRKEVLLSQIPGKDKSLGYKEMVQDYLQEEKRIWEDFRHGLFFGSQEYCKKVKSKYMGDKEPDVEVPQKRLFLREEDLNTVLGRAAASMECDISALINPRRINGLEKDKRTIQDVTLLPIALLLLYYCSIASTLLPYCPLEFYVKVATGQGCFIPGEYLTENTLIMHNTKTRTAIVPSL